MTDAFYANVRETLSSISSDGLYKRERQILSSQSAEIAVLKDGETHRVLNFCANNYLGFADHPELISAATDTMNTYGFGMASVRFICGTQDLHRKLEQRVAGFFGYDDAITFAACFDANGGVFEPLLGEDDAIISDSLNHASIIDGVRLCKAKRYRYPNNNLSELRSCLREAKAKGAKTILIVTDGVFSMDGVIADLAGITALADEFGALVMVDDCHASGVLGARGKGSSEHCSVEGRVDILTGTLGKALGGGMGGFICARQEVIDLLRQRARPYLFSNALTPALVGASLKAFDLLEHDTTRLERLKHNADRFRSKLTNAGFDLIPGEHPIVPIMIGDATRAQEMAERLFYEGVYVIGFSYPVVPKGLARIRVQLSAIHSDDQIDAAVKAFVRVGRDIGVIS